MRRTNTVYLARLATQSVFTGAPPSRPGRSTDPVIVSPSSLPVYFVTNLLPLNSSSTVNATAPSLNDAAEIAVSGISNWPIDAPDRANYRMLGLADLARAVTEGRSPRASGELALHVLEIMEAILRAGETGAAQIIPGTIAKPKELQEEEAKSLLA